MSPSAGPPARALVSLLSFYLSQQEYALPLDRVREIIPLPDHIAELPRPETAVLGVVTLRDRLLPLVSLRALLGLPADDLTQNSAARSLSCRSAKARSVWLSMRPGRFSASIPILSIRHRPC